MSLFTVDSDTDDIEEVMQALSSALRRWEGGGALPLDLSSFSGQDEGLAQQAYQLRFQWSIDGHAIIHSTRPGIGPWIIRFQMVVRRLTWWFLEPIVQQIRLFQMNAARVIDGLARNQARHRESSALQVAEREDLARRVEALEAQVEALQRGTAGPALSEAEGPALPVPSAAEGSEAEGPALPVPSAAEGCETEGPDGREGDGI